MKEIKIGTRKLQQVRGSFVLNMPVVAVRTLNLHQGDAMFVSLTDDGAIRIEKEHGVLPDMNLAGSDQAAPQHTPNRVAANESQS